MLLYLARLIGLNILGGKEVTHDNMIKPAFTTKKLEEERNEKGTRLTLRLNEREIEMLKEVKLAIEQPKDSTAIKTMFYLAYYNVIHDQKTRYLLETLFKNKRNNERTGALVD